MYKTLEDLGFKGHGIGFDKVTDTSHYKIIENVKINRLGFSYKCKAFKKTDSDWVLISQDTALTDYELLQAIALKAQEFARMPMKEYKKPINDKTKYKEYTARKNKVVEYAIKNDYCKAVEILEKDIYKAYVMLYNSVRFPLNEFNKLLRKYDKEVEFDVIGKSIGINKSLDHCIMRLKEYEDLIDYKGE